MTNYNDKKYCGNSKLTEAEAHNRIWFDQSSALISLQNELIALEWKQIDLRTSMRSDIPTHQILKDSSYDAMYNEYDRKIYTNKRKMTKLMQEIDKLRNFLKDFEFVGVGWKSDKPKTLTTEDFNPYLNVLNNGPPIRKRPFTDAELSKELADEDWISEQVEKISQRRQGEPLTKSEKKMLKEFNRKQQNHNIQDRTPDLKATYNRVIQPGQVGVAFTREERRILKAFYIRSHKDAKKDVHSNHLLRQLGKALEKRRSKPGKGRSTPKGLVKKGYPSYPLTEEALTERGKKAVGKFFKTPRPLDYIPKERL